MRVNPSELSSETPGGALKHSLARRASTLSLWEAPPSFSTANKPTWLFGEAVQEMMSISARRRSNRLYFLLIEPQHEVEVWDRAALVDRRGQHAPAIALQKSDDLGGRHVGDQGMPAH